MGVLGRIVIPVPPIEEQDWIVQNYKEETASVRQTVARISESIDRLHELRSALITAAVTGQIDVVTWGKQVGTDRRLEAIEHELEAERDEVGV